MGMHLGQLLMSLSKRTSLINNDLFILYTWYNKYHLFTYKSLNTLLYSFKSVSSSHLSSQENLLSSLESLSGTLHSQMICIDYYSLSIA
jgi:hypothetical protein